MGDLGWRVTGWAAGIWATVVAWEPGWGLLRTKDRESFVLSASWCTGEDQFAFSWLCSHCFDNPTPLNPGDVPLTGRAGRALPTASFTHSPDVY